ncbi:hypothetical protein [Anaerosinus sp.]
MNKLQLIEIWDAIIKLDIVSEGTLSEEIALLVDKIEKIEQGIR